MTEPTDLDGAVSRLTDVEAVLADALRELFDLVKGECPSLLDEDSGGNGWLEMKIADLLAVSGEGGR